MIHKEKFVSKISWDCPLNPIGLGRGEISKSHHGHGGAGAQGAAGDQLDTSNEVLYLPHSRNCRTLFFIKQLPLGHWFTPFRQIWYILLLNFWNKCWIVTQRSHCCPGVIGVIDTAESVQMKFCVWPSAMTQQCHWHGFDTFESWFGSVIGTAGSWLRGVIDTDESVMTSLNPFIYGI